MRLELGEGVNGLCLKLRRQIDVWCANCCEVFARRIAQERHIDLEQVKRHLHLGVTLSGDGLVMTFVVPELMEVGGCELEVILRERIIACGGYFDLRG